MLAKMKKISILKVSLIFVPPKPKNLEAWLPNPMLVTNCNENYTWHFSSSFVAISLYIFCFQGHSTEKSLLEGIMRTEPETKLADMTKIILRYFVWINIFSPFSSLMRCYMKCKNYLSSRSKACTTGHFSAQELKLKLLN